MLQNVIVGILHIQSQRMIIIIIMDNNQNPFGCKRECVSYNNIKKNRAIRSQKKFTEITQPTPPSKQTLKTELIALIQSSPQNESAIQICIEELREKLLQVKNSSKGVQGQPLQHWSILKRKQDNAKGKIRSKTNTGEEPVRVGSRSLKLVSNGKSSGRYQLLNLEQLRNQVKKSKQVVAERRLATEKQSKRYEDLQQIYRSEGKKIQSGRRGQRVRSDVKIRSVTEEVIRLNKNPARVYHPQSLKKTYAKLDRPQQIESNHVHKFNSPNAKMSDNDKISKSSPKKQKKEGSPNRKKLNSNIPIDNNQKIGDISTIMAQKQTLNFLGDSCIGIKQGLQPQKPIADEAKLLDFIEWRTNELKNAFFCGKQQKRKQGLDRLSKIFPKGFFS